MPATLPERLLDLDQLTVGDLGNSQYKNCAFTTIACQMVVKALYCGQTLNFSTENILKDYSELVGFVPGNPATDTGVPIRTVLEYAKHTGIRDADGVRRKIDDYVFLPKNDGAELLRAISKMRTVGVGVRFQDTAAFQTLEDKPWEIIATSKTVCWHYVAALGMSVGGNLLVWHKGCPQEMSWPYYSKFGEGAWAILLERPSELQEQYFGYLKELRRAKKDSGM